MRFNSKTINVYKVSPEVGESISQGRKPLVYNDGLKWRKYNYFVETDIYSAASKDDSCISINEYSLSID